MPSKAVFDAVAAKLAAEWSALPVADYDTGEAPGDATAFVAVQFPLAMADQMSIGAPGQNVFRESGVIRFVVNAERGAAGLAAGLQHADDLAAIFRAKLFGGVRTYAPSPPVIDDRNESGNYQRLSVAVEYDADILA